MDKKNGKNTEILQLVSQLRESKNNPKLIKKLEKEADERRVLEALARIDKDQTGLSIQDIPGITKKQINHEAARLKQSPPVDIQTVSAHVHPSVLSILPSLKGMSCECVIPFSFKRMIKSGAISGPTMTEVTRGIIGAHRMYENEYKIYNSGDTDGLGRVHKNGFLEIQFTAVLPSNDSYYLLKPAGPFYISGSSRVVGHGNFTTCYDSKVWVDFFILLSNENNLLEAFHSQVHYDGTRDGDRTLYYSMNGEMNPGYIKFTANAGDEVILRFRLQVDTAANKDGKAWAYVDMFGFPAVYKTDYDTMVVRD